MSLDDFAEQSVDQQAGEGQQSQSTDDGYSWNSNWHIYPEGYWQDVDPEYFGEGTPNQYPLMEVPERLAAEIEIISDDDVVEDVVEYWFPGKSEQYVEVARITFNDFSTWHLPLRSWDEDYTNTREELVKDYVPEVIRWEAIIEGRDPDEAIEEWDKPWEIEDPEWFSDVGDTGMSEETRKWLNDEIDGLSRVDRKVSSSSEDVELDIDDDDDWTDDW